jgi:hypothetical protein
LPFFCWIGVDQQTLKPSGRIRCLNSAHNGSASMSVTSTGRLSQAAVPQEPTSGPMRTPSSWDE